MVANRDIVERAKRRSAILPTHRRRRLASSSMRRMRPLRLCPTRSANRRRSCVIRSPIISTAHGRRRGPGPWARRHGSPTALAALLRTFTKLYASRGIEFSAQARMRSGFRGAAGFRRHGWQSRRQRRQMGARSGAGGGCSRHDKSEGRSALRILDRRRRPGPRPELRDAATQRGRRLLDETKPGSGLGLSDRGRSRRSLWRFAAIDEAPVEACGPSFAPGF